MNWVPLRRGLAVLSLAVLAACGGGRSQVEPFAPTRLLSFGDEFSVLTADGKRYGINGLKTDGTGAVDCALNPMWIQTLATQFKLGMSQCNPSSLAVAVTLRGQAGAKVADVKAQIDAQLAAGAVGPKDLITVQGGFHDLIELYLQYPAKTAAELTTQAQARGKALAEQVNRLANLNGRILVLTVLDPSTTPQGLAETAASADRGTLLQEMAKAFNLGLRMGLIEDGRLIGLVLADETITQIVKFASFYGYDNVTHVACATALPNCTPSTLVAEAVGKNWLWADALHLGAGGQQQIANAAVTRALNNPF
ncbi:esterase [Inhella gelatinilytica]|uniref:Esterase n=1 Tax=Inhella gelatinilytica TaxID=2795030 RepID=A0A931NA95_9BURK|nr:esterase [Inhella gelatinilytica]MBH9552228.1 esterase [Inhella gelatinilytica]